MKRTILNHFAAVMIAGAGCATASQAGNSGVPRVCLVPHEVSLIGSPQSIASDVVRDTFTSYLEGPSIRTQVLRARLASQAAAKVSGCDAAAHISLGRPIDSDVVRSAAMNTVYSASELARFNQGKDEFRLEYRLEDARDGGPLLDAKLFATAKSNGEDLISILVKKAAEAVLPAAAKLAPATGARQ
jgi:hypothetical protein